MGDEIGGLMYEAFILIIQLAGPLLLISMLVGILISIIRHRSGNVNSCKLPGFYTILL